MVPRMVTVMSMIVTLRTGGNLVVNGIVDIEPCCSTEPCRKVDRAREHCTMKVGLGTLAWEGR